MFDTWDCAFSTLSIPCSYIRWEKIPIKTDTVFVDACFVGPVPEAVSICRLSPGCHRQLFFFFSPIWIHFFSSDCILSYSYSSSQPQPCTSSSSDHRHRLTLSWHLSAGLRTTAENPTLSPSADGSFLPFPRSYGKVRHGTFPARFRPTSDVFSHSWNNKWRWTGVPSRPPRRRTMAWLRDPSKLVRCRQLRASRRILQHTRGIPRRRS